LVAHDQLVEGGKLTADGLPTRAMSIFWPGSSTLPALCLHLVGHDSPISHVDSTAA